MVQLTYGSRVAMTVTNLQSLASSATVGWQSDVIDNRTTRAIDYRFQLVLPMANTAPANDRSWYFFASPAMHNGSAWVFSDGGTVTMPSGTQGAYTIAGTTSTNNLALLSRLFYTTQNQVVQGSFSLAPILGPSIPEGFSLIGINFTGAAASTGCVVAYQAIT